MSEYRPKHSWWHTTGNRSTADCNCSNWWNPMFCQRHQEPEYARYHAKHRADR